MIRIIVVCLLFAGIIGRSAQAQTAVEGRVKDALNATPLPFVNITLQTADSLVVAGTATDNEGRFVLQNIGAGDYWLTVSYVGYQTQFIELKGLASNLALNDILLSEEAIGLDAVTVTGTAIGSRIDRKLVFPTERQIKASSNGIELLQQLMLARLDIHPLTRELSLAGGGEVQLRINGATADKNDVLALRPADIIRVEYHDSPGLRYGDAAAVVDFIVRHRETGGNLGVDAKNAFRVKMLGDDGLHARINHRESEFALNYFLMYRDYQRMWREYEETFHLPDGSFLLRKEESQPGALRVNHHSLGLTYGYQTDNRMFTAFFRYVDNAVPHELYRGKLFDIAHPEAAVQMTDINRYYMSRPALDLYYQENLKNRQTVIVNLVGTYIRNSSNREYRESISDNLLTDINNAVNGNKYSLIGEGIYEKTFNAGTLSAGMRHRQEWTDNTYRNGHQWQTNIQQSETRLHTEWKAKVRNLDYRLGVGATHAVSEQKYAGTEYNKWTFNPRFTLRLTLPHRQSLQLIGRIQNNMPSLSELSAVEQEIDSLRVQRGNPSLKPYLIYRSELTYECQTGIFTVNVRGLYERKPSAIMEEYFWEAGRVVRTFSNQKSWEWMNASAIVHVKPLKDILTLSSFFGVNRYVSLGHRYRHTYNNPFITLRANATWRNFGAYVEWIESWNHFEGESMYGGENRHFMSVSYTYKDMKFGIGAYNPFVANFHMDGENRSEQASYLRSFHNDEFAQLFLFTFSYNLNFGRVFQTNRKQITNSDEDAGIMKAGK